MSHPSLLLQALHKLFSPFFPILVAVCACLQACFSAETAVIKHLMMPSKTTRKNIRMMVVFFIQKKKLSFLQSITSYQTLFFSQRSLLYRHFGICMKTRDWLTGCGWPLAHGQSLALDQRPELFKHIGRAVALNPIWWGEKEWALEQYVWSRTDLVSDSDWLMRRACLQRGSHIKLKNY